MKPLPDKLLNRRLKTHKAVGILEAIPTEDPRKTQRTMSASQMRLCMLALDLDPKELCGLFRISSNTFHNWSGERTPVPKGIADYLRLRVAQRIRSMAIATGTPVQLPEDVADNPSLKALSAVEVILEDLKAYLAE